MVEHKRIDTSKLDENIFHPKKSDVLDADNSIFPSVTVYTIMGKQDGADENGIPVLYDGIHERPNHPDVIIYAESSDDAYAKKTFNGNRSRFYIKANHQGEFYSPLGIYEEKGATQLRHGEPMWKFREVNQRIFDMYASFLKTKNIAWLKNAERACR